MIHPVLSPKRKEFGFLKAPSQKKNLARSFMFSQEINDAIPKNAILDSTSKSFSFNYKFDPLNLKYEIKTFGPKFTANLDSLKLNKSNTFASSYSRYTLNTELPNPNENALKSAHYQRQAYTTVNGTNVNNQLKKHTILSIPLNPINQSTSAFQFHNNYNNELEFVKNYTKKREKSSISSCTNCGKLYYDLKCLNCEFEKKKKYDKTLLPKLGKKRSKSNNRLYDPSRNSKYSSNQSSLIRSELKSVYSPDLRCSSINNESSGLKTILGEKIKTQSSTSQINNGNNNSQITSTNFNKYDSNYKYHPEDETEDANIPKLTLWLV